MRDVTSTDSRPRVFVACPFTIHLDAETKLVDAAVRAMLTSVADELDARGFDYFLAMEREEWGAQLMPPEICVPLDHEEMVAADAVLALPGGSVGVGVELGWATAMQKPIVLVLNADGDYSPMVTGLAMLPSARVELFIAEPSEGDRVPAAAFDALARVAGAGLKQSSLAM